MTKVGEAYTGIWPKHPVKKLEIGQVVRYPEPETGIIRQGKVSAFGPQTVTFIDGNWCFRSEIGEDRD